jgi:hypothetical protein
MTTTRELSGTRSPTPDGALLPRRLASTVVAYEHRPDRRTVYPPGLSGVPRMSTWLTADVDAFVDLESVR